MFSYACPFCTQRLLAPPERAGQRTICPKCLRPLAIPTPEQAARDDPQVDLGGKYPEPLVDTPFGDDPHEAEATPPPADAYAAVGRGGPATRVKAPRPLQAPAARRSGSTSRTETGMVCLNPTGLAAVDIGAQLSANLTMRMKPPPDPPADLNLSTGGWLALTALAAATWVGGVIYDPVLLPFVALLGVLMIAFAYLWGAYLAGQRDWVRGVVTLLPPVAAWRLCLPFGENGYWPLRFALTGLLVMALYWAGPVAHGVVQPAIAALDFTRSEAAPVEVLSTADRLKAAAAQPESAVNYLIDLATTDTRKGIDPAERPAVVAEVTRLTTPAGSDRPAVRSQALRTLTVWSAADARPAVLAALASPESMERKVALDLAARWPDREMAHAVAARLANRSEGSLAREVLLQMNPPAAEAALLKLLKSDDPIVVLTAVDLLERVGGPAAVADLTVLARSESNESLRDEATKAAGAITSRLAKSAGE